MKQKINWIVYIGIVVIAIGIGAILFSQKETRNVDTTLLGETELPTLRLVHLDKVLSLPASIENVVPTDDGEILAKKINEILTNPRLNGVITGISVRRADNGELIYSNDGDTLLRPASNMKLLTAATALEVLGPKYQFRTELWINGEVRNGDLEGDLILKGKGDPTLLKRDLDAFAEKIKEMGIEHIKGDLIGDDFWYDDVRYSQDLIWSDESYYYGGQISALTLSPDEDYDAGTVFVDVSPAEKVGDPPIVEVFPVNDYVHIMNEAETVASGKSSGLSIEREHGTNRVFVKGQISQNTAKQRRWIAVWEPTGYALSVFQQSLEEQGIQLSANSKRRIAETPNEANLVVTKKSMPLEELLIPFMKLSNNIHAETLVKEMGKVVYGEGSWNQGLKVMEEELVKFGLDRSSFYLRDGSGISDKNLISPNQITKLLWEVRDKSWYPAFENSQPIAGEPWRLVGGTLRYRMADPETRGKIKAKTGSITGANTLSGYVTAENGDELVFSIMMNNFIQGSMTRIQDEICAVLVEYLEN